MLSTKHSLLVLLCAQHHGFYLPIYWSFFPAEQLGHRDDSLLSIHVTCTAVGECCQDGDQNQLERAKFSPAALKPLNRSLPKFTQVIKARSTPATMSKQHCRMLQCRMLLRQCCRFWKQCRSNVLLCCQKRQQCRSNRQQSFLSNACRSNRQLCCLLLRQCCFDIVASVDRA